MAMDEQHKTLKKLISLCLLANLITLGVVVYGTFYQDQEQKLAMEKLQSSVLWRQLYTQPNTVMYNVDGAEEMPGVEPVAMGPDETVNYDITDDAIVSAPVDPNMPGVEPVAMGPDETVDWRDVTHDPVYGEPIDPDAPTYFPEIIQQSAKFQEKLQEMFAFVGDPNETWSADATELASITPQTPEECSSIAVLNAKVDRFIEEQNANNNCL